MRSDIQYKREKINEVLIALNDAITTCKEYVNKHYYEFYDKNGQNLQDLCNYLQALKSSLINSEVDINWLRVYEQKMRDAINWATKQQLNFARNKQQGTTVDLGNGVKEYEVPRIEGLAYKISLAIEKYKRFISIMPYKDVQSDVDYEDLLKKLAVTIDNYDKEIIKRSKF